MVLKSNLAPLRHLFAYQISRQSENGFVFYDNFHTLMKRKKKRKTRRKKNQILKIHVLEMPGMKCEMVTLAGISTAKIVW